MGFLYRRLDVRPLVVVGRRPVAVTHLAQARRQKKGNGIPGLIKTDLFNGPFFEYSVGVKRNTEEISW